MSLSRIKLRYYSDEEIRALAVIKITHSGTYDRGVPKLEGLNDPRLGLVDHTIRCPTCFKSNCDQHYGFVELVRPVYRVGVINLVIMILRCICRECARSKYTFDSENNDLVYISEAIQKLKNPKERLRIISDLCKNKLTCLFCAAPQPQYARRARCFIDATYRSKELMSEFVVKRGAKYLKFLKARFMPDDAASMLWAMENTMRLHMELDRPENLVINLQIIPPPNIRPSNFVGETKVRSENDMTCALQDIVRTNLELSEFLNGTNDKSTYENLYDKLQVMVSGVVNHAIKRSAAQAGILPMITATSKRKIIDLRTRLNGKKARVRGNLNGKRVDQSARTVISGDSSYDIDVLGVPSVIMNKLTFPEPVTNQNIKLMASKVVLGAHVNGGALSVKPPNHATDSVFWLPILDREGRIELAAQLRPGWIVERHLCENDWILFNRQPTLWKASMMAFRCKRVEGLTIRVPLVVTRAFNADFDGDEMNLHSLQGYEALAEAQELMRVDNQIITPQSGTVVIGLVQDSLVGAWRLTAQDCFFNLDSALNLLMALDYEVPGRGSTDKEYKASVDSKTATRMTFDLPPPAIFTAHKKYWTGKQLASLLLPTRLNIYSTDIAGESFDKASGLFVRNGEILNGRLSKASLGASNRGLIQSIWRLYGPGGAHKFISDAQRLFVKHLNHDGPTQSILDCLSASETTTLDILNRDLGRSDSILNLDLPIEIKEAKSVAILQETLRAVGASVLASVKKNCALADCVNSGSKGNVMNIAQIGGCVGQQTVYGRRVPIKQTRIGQRTLIYYAPGDLRAEARGFIANSYIRGLTPIETFEHQMAGREGIVATAVNTSETGYNQRRMIKGQESQRLCYDGMVRVADNKIVQVAYGGDDLDGSRLERIRFSWLIKGPLPFSEKTHKFPIVQRALRMAKAYMAWNANLYKELDPTFACAVNFKAILSESIIENSMEPEKAINLLCSLIETIHARHHATKNALWNSSIFASVLQAAENIQFLNSKSIDLIAEHYAKSIIAPGEGVGALGASSIGEPSMQKTLNTFHYAGIADKNVTITGLPRFKQLINGVDTYETANMTAQVTNYGDTSSALQISRVMLWELLDSEITLGSVPKKNFSDYFACFDAQRGPFSAKFGPNLSENLQTIVLKINWNSCARKNISLETVTKSLRSTFSYDACIIKKPQWSGEDHVSIIEIVLAPWIFGSKAICDALKSQQQVRGLDYIKNSIVFQETRYDKECAKSSNHVVETEGSNVIQLASCSFIKPETIRTNNVLEAFSTFGISAGIVVLQSELHLVLSFDGSYIDPRHTWLLADTMGRNGTLAAMNRHHMVDLGSSLLQEASFERSLEVFEEGAAHGRSDNLVGATERIIVGQPVGIGTGLVEIIHTQKTPSLEPQLMVAGLDEYVEDFYNDDDFKNTMKEEVVRPMHYKGPETEHFGPSAFDSKAFATNLMEHSKITSDSWIEKCVRQFRGLAAEKRLLPVIKITCKLTEARYRAGLTNCWSFQWTSQESTALETEVFWKLLSKESDSSYGITILNTDAPNPSYKIVTFFNESSRAGQRCEIYSKNKIEPIDMPFGVEPTRVNMRQQTKFERNGFSLTLARQWTGNNNVEAEESLLKSPGTFISILEIVDSESILQNRCSDAQLGNAIFMRLP